MKYRKKLCSAVLSAVILLSLAGCGEMPLPEGYKELPATIKAEDVVLDKNEPAYKRTEYYYKNDKLESTSVSYYDAYDNRIISDQDSGKNEYRYKYDENGNILEQASYTSDGTPFELTRNTYNADGLVQSAAKYIVSSENSKELEIWRYYENEYDDKGSLVRKVTVRSNGTVFKDDYKYEYDENGNAVKETNDLFYVYYYTYDSRGNMLSKNKKYETLFKTKDKAAYLYEYDSNDNLIRKESHSETGDSVETYEYDDMGRLTHRTTGSTECICEYEELDN